MIRITHPFRFICSVLGFALFTACLGWAAGAIYALGIFVGSLEMEFRQ